MIISATFRRRLKSLARSAKAHGILLTILTFLVITVGSTRFLRGSILPGITVQPVSDPTSLIPLLPSLRTCSATGTVFETIWNFSALEKKFLEDMRAVTNERVNLLFSPSRLSCLSDQQPQMPALESMAVRLPGLYFQEQYPEQAGIATKTSIRPITWNAFSTVVTEYERVYECRLAEIASRGVIVVAADLDEDQPKQYCCDGSPWVCVPALTAKSCQTGWSTDPNCDKVCPPPCCEDPVNQSYKFASRLQPLTTRMSNERNHARVALERTLNTLRSFETNYAIAKQLNCFERGSVDLQNELSLLSDAASCLPRIWDVVTSIHDRKEQQ